MMEILRVVAELIEVIFYTGTTIWMYLTSKENKNRTEYLLSVLITVICVMAANMK